MDIKRLVETLHPLERSVVPFLKDNNKLSEIIIKTKLKDVEVVRALQWLENKDVLKIKSDDKEVISLDVNGREYLEKGLPERRFLDKVDEEIDFKLLKDKAELDEEELKLCLGLLKGKAAITFANGKVKITAHGQKLKSKDFLEEELLKKLPLELKSLKPEEKFAFESLKKRKKIIKLDLVKTKHIELTDLGRILVNAKIHSDMIDSLNPKILKEGSWKNKKIRRYDVRINVPKIYPGKRHFTNQAIEYVKRIWLDLGFKEMQGPMVQVGLWNFDALFTAQDHPVREMQDTYFIKNPAKGKLLNKEVVERIRKTHEDGWTTGSKGWRYKWNPEEAMKNVLRTHTTCLSAKYISNLKEKDLPAKYFAVGKNFRNETLDWSHLSELIQVEGIVVDPNADFRHLVGYLKNFFNKMGFERVRVRPAYFPYTEPSAEVDVFHPVHKKWVELGGSGMFRPEVTKPLFGKEVPVLAWGLGFDRSIMEYYKLNDIRDLYKNDVKQLKEMKVWLK